MEVVMYLTAGAGDGVSHTENFAGKEITVFDDGSAMVDGRLFLDGLEEAKAYIRARTQRGTDAAAKIASIMKSGKSSYGAIMDFSRQELFGQEISREDLFGGDAFIDAGAFLPTAGRSSTSRSDLFDGEGDSNYGALSSLGLMQELRYVNDDPRLDNSARLCRKKYRST